MTSYYRTTCHCLFRQLTAFWAIDACHKGSRELCAWVYQTVVQIPFTLSVTRAHLLTQTWKSIYTCLATILFPGGGGGGGLLPKVFGEGVRSKPWNLYSISDRNLWYSIHYFRPERKINTPLKSSKIITRLLYMIVANHEWLWFTETFEKGYKFAKVDAEKIVP